MSRLAHMEQASNPSRSRARRGQVIDLRAIAVDFYLYSGHEIAVWEPIWRSLRRRGVDAQFVLEAPGVHTATGSTPNAAHGWHDDKDGEVSPLVDDPSYALMRDILERRALPHIDQSRTNADAVITTQGVGWLFRYGDALRIKTEYGASAFVGAHGHGSINQGHDLVLAHGAFSKSAISAHLPPLRIRVVGYPKWAPTRRSGLTSTGARQALGIESDQPLLAWLPTWAHNSGIDRYSEALAQLADRYLIVAKPHHNNLRFEAERLRAIDPRISVRSDLHSLVPLLLAADIAVVDSRSGALAETFLADRPVVGLLPGVEPSDHGVLDGLGDAAVWCREPTDLPNAIAEASSSDRSAARAAWRRWFFADLGDRDDEVAADAIIDAVRNRTPQTSASLPLDAVDALAAHTDASDPDDVLATVDAAWPLWPAHPGLLGLIERATPHLQASALLVLSRLVRESHEVGNCPLRSAMQNNDYDPVIRLTAAAMAAIELEDDTAAEHFHALVAEVPADRFDDTFHELDLVPSAVPVFVQLAATTPERCRALASGLDRLGAAEEARAVDAYGATLVTQ